MQQTSLSSTANPEAKKNKKLVLTQQHGATSKEIAKQIKRLKSNHELHETEKEEQKKNLPVKPRSSAGRRPMSSRKPSETMNSQTTTSSGMAETEVKELIANIFSHSKKLKQFLSEKEMQEETAFTNLVNNELFTLSLVTMVSNKSHEEATEYVENSCINKLQRIMAMEKQKKLCEGIESKISSLIDNRIRILSAFK